MKKLILWGTLFFSIAGPNCFADGIDWYSLWGKIRPKPAVKVETPDPYAITGPKAIFVREFCEKYHPNQLAVADCVIQENIIARNRRKNKERPFNLASLAQDMCDGLARRPVRGILPSRTDRYQKSVICLQATQGLIGQHRDVEENRIALDGLMAWNNFCNSQPRQEVELSDGGTCLKLAYLNVGFHTLAPRVATRSYVDQYEDPAGPAAKESERKPIDSETAPD